MNPKQVATVTIGTIFFALIVVYQPRGYEGMLFDGSSYVPFWNPMPKDSNTEYFMPDAWVTGMLCVALMTISSCVLLGEKGKLDRVIFVFTVWSLFTWNVISAATETNDAFRVMSATLVGMVLAGTVLTVTIVLHVDGIRRSKRSKIQ